MADREGVARFEVYRDEIGEHRWRLRAVNGEIVAVSEGYETEDGAWEGAETVQRLAGDAVVEERDG